MGSVGDAYDNAICESFFATLECELIERRSFRNQAEAKMAVFDFIEAWYNPHRRHSALGQISPLNYEKKHSRRHDSQTEDRPRKRGNSTLSRRAVRRLSFCFPLHLFAAKPSHRPSQVGAVDIRARGARDSRRSDVLCR